MQRWIQMLAVLVAVSSAATAGAKEEDKAKPAKPGVGEKGAMPAKSPKADKGKADEAKGKADEAKGKADKPGDAEPVGDDSVPLVDVAAGAPGDEIGKLKGKEKREALKERAAKLRDSRGQRKQIARDKQRSRLKTILKGKPMDEALKQQLQHHARRLARLERILEVAAEAKDDKSVARVEKLLTKEGEHHDKWMEKYAANPGGGEGEPDKDPKDEPDKEDKIDKDPAGKAKGHDKQGGEK